MITEQTHITLNGKTYSGSSLTAVIGSGLKPQTGDEYEHEIYSFLKEWLDDSDHIEMFTSGSTGKPAPVRLKKAHMVNSARLTVTTLNLGNTDTALLCLPVRYIAGKMMIVRAFVAGYNLLTIKPSGNPFQELANEISFTALTPHQLFHSIEKLRHNMVKKTIIGGGEIPVNLENEMKDLPGDVYATYGMTETSSHVALRRVNGKDRSESYHAMKDIRFSTDARECLVIDAPMLSDHKIVTNDVVELIDNSHFRWLGRVDNVINSGGIKIFPEVLEKKVSGFIKVNFFIGALPDKKFREKTVLFLESDPLSPVRKKALSEELEKVLAPYEMPRDIVCLNRFYFTKTGKILRTETLTQVMV